MAVLVHVEDEALDRLGQLGLEQAWIVRALQRGDAESRTVSQLAPKGFEGTTRWGRAAEYFREQACAKGWTPDDTMNIARSISLSGEVSIIVTTGSKGTGIEGADPTTKYTKGAGVVASIEANLVLDFDPEYLVATGMRQAPRPDKPMQTWLLMFAVENNKIYSEVSMPDAISADGVITSWRERIIMPVIDLRPEVVIGDDQSGPTDPVNVPVSRR